MGAASPLLFCGIFEPKLRKIFNSLNTNARRQALKDFTLAQRIGRHFPESSRRLTQTPLQSDWVLPLGVTSPEFWGLLQRIRADKPPLQP